MKVVSSWFTQTRMVKVYSNIFSRFYIHHWTWCSVILQYEHISTAATLQIFCCTDARHICFYFSKQTPYRKQNSNKSCTDL